MALFGGWEGLENVRGGDEDVAVYLIAELSWKIEESGHWG